MAKIETYSLDTSISSNDIILGTDGDNNNITKNFLVEALKTYIISGLSPIVGGTLKITEIIGDVGEILPETVMNTLDPAYSIAPYEIVITTCDNGTRYLFKKNNGIYGVGQLQTVLGDFIKIYEVINYVAPDGSETKVNVGTGLSKSGNGTIATPYVITNTSPDQTVALTQGGATTITGTYPNFTISSTDTDTIADGSETKINVTAPITKSGIGTVGNPYVIGITQNLQKTITASYELVEADNNYTIIVNNGATPINITVPIGLSSAFFVGIIQKGTGDITFVASGTTLLNPIGLKSKGQYYSTALEQEGTTNTFYLLGNTKI